MSVEPTVDPLAAYRPLARVPPHRGTASFTLGDEALSGPAEFLLPPGGQAVVAFRVPADLTSQGFGRELVIVGDTEAGPFRLECAQIYVRKASRFDDGSSWSVISPINGPVRIIRLVRNAVVHGSTPPTADNVELRLLFDKWKLFLFRRVLIRLGYAGKVASPHKGWASSSDVGDFSQEHNDFTPADPNAPDPWRELVRRFREQQVCAENNAP